MMFVLRLTFWLLLICLLLPGQREDNQRLISSAGKAFHDVAGFCTRNPDVCQDARHAATLVLTRLKSGTEVVQDWMAETKSQDPQTLGGGWAERLFQDQDERQAQARLGQAGGQPQDPQAHEALPQWKNSLNPTDRQLPWRGPGGL